MSEHDPDEHLRPLERVRACGHRDVDKVCKVWEPALVDAGARGYGTGRSFDGTPRGTGELTSVEAAASRPDFATAWLAELGDVLAAMGVGPTAFVIRASGAVSEIRLTPHNSSALLHGRVDRICDEWTSMSNKVLRRLHYLAERAAQHWPEPPKRGEVVDGVTVGERGNQASVCGACGGPVVSGRDPVTQLPLLKQWVDRKMYHNTPECWGSVYRPRADVAPCGTVPGYRRHLRNGERACEACLLANRRVSYASRRAS